MHAGAWVLRVFGCRAWLRCEVAVLGWCAYGQGALIACRAVKKGCPRSGWEWGGVAGREFEGVTGEGRVGSVGDMNSQAQGGLDADRALHVM
jgi:hypothetical protein